MLVEDRLTMGNRPTLYVLSALLFPLALAGFFVGFACPVWKVYNNNRNDGLWQTCEVVIQNCSYLSFYDFGKPLNPKYFCFVIFVFTSLPHP